MTPLNNSDRRKKIILFSFILIATAAMATLLFATFWQKENVPVVLLTPSNDATNSPARYNKVLSNNDILATRVDLLQQLDQRYAELLTDPNKLKQLEVVNQQINVQEEIFRATIDSIFINGQGESDEGLNKLSNNIIHNYRVLLDGRRSISSLRNAISINKTGLNPNEVATLKTQNELQKKNDKITALESTIKAMSAVNNNAAASNTIGGMAALKATIAAQENRIAILISTNNNLKQENEKLLKQQNDMAKPASPGEVILKNKATSLQQKIGELNADLRLAQVDCNLSRVDAAQIIFNSKQRKLLLSEASNILTALSKTDDEIIKKKVQDKIIRLNQVAANFKE